MIRFIVAVLAACLAASAYAADKPAKKKKKPYDYEKSKYKAAAPPIESTYRFDAEGKPVKPKKGAKAKKKPKPEPMPEDAPEAAAEAQTPAAPPPEEQSASPNP